MSKEGYFLGRKAVIATMHGKERVIAPFVENILGIQTVLPPAAFNSDVFGTFTGEVKRQGTQLEAARKKAQAAMDLTGCDLAISSEGSFGPDPAMPFLQSNLELVLFVDRKNQFEVKGHYRTSAAYMGIHSAHTLEEALVLAKKMAFPTHGLIVRTSQNGGAIHKDLQTVKALKEALAKLFDGQFTQVFLETDLRAHRNPTRMEAIKHATEDLIKNIASRCPSCNCPGFVVSHLQKGLKCAACGTPTELPIHQVYSCSKCDYSETRPCTKHSATADPKYCDYCSP